MIFLGREISEQRNYSEKVAEEIDEEVRRLIDKAHETAKQLLTDNRGKLDEVVEWILIKETMEGDELTKLLDAPVGELALPEEPKSESPPKKDEPDEKTEPQTGKPGLAYGGQTPIQLNPDS